VASAGLAGFGSFHAALGNNFVLSGWRVTLALNRSACRRSPERIRGKHPYLYQHHTWVELKEVAKKSRWLIRPIGSAETSGPHLPLDVDNFLIWRICEEGLVAPTATSS
jgi:hypothetical protein